MKKEHAFKLHMGAELHSLEDLKLALRTMDDATFHHHANSHKNDFAAWVESILSDKAIAERIRAAKTKDRMLEALEVGELKVEHKHIDEELKDIKSKLDEIAWRDFSIGKKEDVIEKMEERIVHDAERGFGIRELLYALLGFSLGMLFMVGMKVIGVF